MPTLVSKGVSAPLGLVAAACVVGFVAELPIECGPDGDDLLTEVLTVAAGCSVAAALVFGKVGGRRSIWLWVGAVACGAVLSGVLWLIAVWSCVGACTN